MSNSEKSLHDLRQIAQGLGIDNIFQKDRIQLEQEIGSKQEQGFEGDTPPVQVIQPPYDARLMTKFPSRKSNEQDVRDLLKPYTDIGLHLGFPDAETWQMQFGDKIDTGSLRQPLRAILGCAARVMA